MDMRMNRWTLAATAALLGLFSTLSATADDHGGNSLSWAVTPYLWAPNTTIDLTLGDNNIGGEVSFSDILDTIDAGFMGHLEGGKGNWSAFADLTYVDASDTTERTLIRITSQNTQTFLDVALAWHPGGIGESFSVFGGLRYTGAETRFDFVSVPNDTPLGSQRSDADFYDALLGLRYRFDLSERWSLQTRGDVSFGDTEGTLLARASFAYTVGERRENRILFGYQYKQLEFKDSGVTTKIRLAGPTAGFSFRF
jgi:hypothetical protein